MKQLFVKAKISPEEFELIKDELVAAGSVEVVEFEQLDENSEAGFICEIDI